MTVATGSQALAADIFGGRVTTLVYKTADETVNNSNDFQNDDHLVFAVTANSIWIVQYFLHVLQGANNDVDIKVTVTVPAEGTDMIMGRTMEPAAATSADDTFIVNAGNASVVDLASGEEKLIFHRLLIQNGANAGNVQLQWAQQVAAAVDTKLLKGSCLIGWRIV